VKAGEAAVLYCSHKARGKAEYEQASTSSQSKHRR
jgi:hypothetical protein